MEKHQDVPNLTQALFILVALLGIEILVAAVFIDINGRFMSGDPVAGGIIAVFAFGLMLSALMTYKHLGFAALIHSSPISVKAVVGVLTLPVIIFFLGAAVLIEDLLALVVALLPMTQDQYDMFQQLMAGGAASLITLCVVAPFIEEMLFRGIFLRSFLHQYSVRQSIVFSSLLFGIAHLNIYQAIGAFLLGVVFGWLYVRTRSLWPSIIAHGAYNLACFGLATTNAVPELPSLELQILAAGGVLAGGTALWKLLGGEPMRRSAKRLNDAAHFDDFRLRLLVAHRLPSVKR
jgi:uncharacterized protein